MENKFCKQCGNKVSLMTKFCGSCGNNVSSIKSKLSEDVIKCGNCDYIGAGEINRRLISKILAWVCVVFAPLITIIYFVSNPKYRCPKCKSTFVGIKNENGVFVSRKTGMKSPVMIVIWVLLGIAIIGIVSAVISDSIEKPKNNTSQNSDVLSSWFNYVSPSDSFNVLLPTYPTFEKKENLQTDSPDLFYSYHQYLSTQDKTSYIIFKYIYSDNIDLQNVDKLLNSYLNKLVSGKKSTLTNSSFGYYNGYRSLDFLADIEDETLKGRVVLVGETPYLLMMDYYKENYDEEKYNKFINSFNLK